MAQQDTTSKSSRLRAAGALAGAAWLIATSAVHAEPLPKETCELLVAEHDKLTAAGVKVWMAPGTQDARTRLGTEKLSQVARFIEVDEQLLFRCGHHKARFVLPADVEEPAPEPPTPAPAAKTPAANAKPKPEPERKKSKQAATAPETADPPPPPAKPAAKKKLKAEDAYRPATQPNVD